MLVAIIEYNFQQSSTLCVSNLFTRQFLLADIMPFINRDAFLSREEVFEDLDADAAFGFFTIDAD